MGDEANQSLDIKQKLNQSGFAPIIVLLAVVILIGLMGALYFGTQRDKGMSSLQPAISPSQPTMIIDKPTNAISQLSPTITSAADPTVNWKTYTNIKYGYKIQFPSTWRIISTEQDGELGNFTIKSENNERIHGTIFNGKPDSSQDIQNNGASWSFVLDDNKYIFVTYVKCDGPGCDLGNKQKVIFNQILSTFRFTAENPTPIDYFLPSGWKTTQDKLNKLEVGYDPTTHEVGSLIDNAIELYGKWQDNPAKHLGLSVSVSIISYDGSSRHQILYKKIGITNQTTSWKSPDYHEKEYLYNSWSCLVLYGIGISQYPSTWGLCPINNSQAVLFTTFREDAGTEQIIKTIKIVK